MKTAELKIDKNIMLGKVSRNIYGHFSEHLGRCIYNGIFVGEDSKIPNKNGMRTDVVNALKDIKIPVLRWPGGCFADEYHWMDGIGPKQSRKKMINSNWGAVTEDNSFGTHEFFELCDQLGCEPYLAVNLGSGTVREASEWIEYITSDGVSPMTELRQKNGRELPWRLKYVGIGNENWGCGGNMSPLYYANEFRRYQTFCRNYGSNTLFKIACGPNADDYNWTETLMANLSPCHANAISLHYYTIPSGDWNAKGSATKFSDREFYDTISKTLHINEIINKHLQIMRKYDKDNDIKLVIDEWGCWYDVEKGTDPGFLYQQNTMRDALVAACNLNIFNSYADNIEMANIAQVVNVLQAVILTDDLYIVKTPTYYVFKMFIPHHDSILVKSQLSGFKTDNNSLDALSASVTKSGDQLFATISNCSLDQDCELFINADKIIDVQIISAESPRAYNDFRKDENVSLKDYHNFKTVNGGVCVTVPKCSIVSLKLL